jgi:hypothetical protein
MSATRARRVHRERAVAAKRRRGGVQQLRHQRVRLLRPQVCDCVEGAGHDVGVRRRVGGDALAQRAQHHVRHAVAQRFQASVVADGQKGAGQLRHARQQVRLDGRVRAVLVNLARKRSGAVACALDARVRGFSQRLDLPRQVTGQGLDGGALLVGAQRALHSSTHSTLVKRGETLCLRTPPRRSQPVHVRAGPRAGARRPARRASGASGGAQARHAAAPSVRTGGAACVTQLAAARTKAV